jgi:N-acetylglucosamine-6-phosphate deacetylase
MMDFTGAPLEDVVQMATLNPSRVIGKDKLLGSIELGKRADLAVVDDKLNVLYVFTKGRKVFDYCAQKAM